MGVSENIDALMAEYDIPASSIARAAGVSEASVSEWRNKGVIPRRQNLERLCSYFGLKQDDILSDSNGFAAKTHGISNPTSSNGWVDMPLYGSIAAGTPLEMLPVNDTYPAPKEIADRYPQGFWLKVSSDSMNLMFPQGALVYVNPMDEVRVNGKPYALCVNGYEATVKLTEKLSNGYRLIPASTDPTYKPQVYDYSVEGTDKITVIGEIVYDMKPFDWRY